MAQKKITDLQLRDDVTDDLSFATDDGIQSYRVTGAQILEYVLDDDPITRDMLQTGAVGKLTVSAVKTAAYTALTTDDVIRADATTADFAVTLYTAVGNSGRQLVIKKTTAANKVTVTANGAETIDGSATFVLYFAYDEVTLVSDGAGWIVVHQVKAQVYAEYRSDTAQSMTGATTTLINYEDVTSDSHSSVTIGAAWKFTAKRPGFYLFSAGWQPNSIAANGQFYIHIYKNGVFNRVLDRRRNYNAGTDDQPIRAGGGIYLAAGDYIDFRGELTSATTTRTNSVNYNWVTISG